MIKCEHNGPQISCQRTYYKGFDGANILKWNLEIEPFVVQTKEDMHELGAIKDHRPP
jgi:hypothetical protein